MAHQLGLLDYQWYKSAESKPFITKVADTNLQTFKKFGYIDKVQFDKKLKEFQYKVILSGKSGCGKTSTAYRLGGYEVPRLHRETPGIENTNIVWPARLMGSKEPVVFRMKFCDSGENCMNRFSHIVTSMKENSDAVIYFFSMIDRSSFEDIPQQMSRFSSPESTQNELAQLVIGTKLDLQSKVEVSQKDITDFEKQHDIPVLQISNFSIAIREESSFLDEVAPILNCICERLWYRDQVEAGLVI